MVNVLRIFNDATGVVRYGGITHSERTHYLCLSACVHAFMRACADACANAHRNLRRARAKTHNIHTYKLDAQKQQNTQWGDMGIQASAS